jgi:hypothetical protein
MLATRHQLTLLAILHVDVEWLSASISGTPPYLSLLAWKIQDRVEVHQITQPMALSPTSTTSPPTTYSGQTTARKHTGLGTKLKWSVARLLRC